MASTITLDLGLFLFLSFSLNCLAFTVTSHVQIVYLGHNNGRDPLLTTAGHVQLLSTVFSNEDEAKQAILYSYSRSFSGFAAVINSTQAITLASMEEVISVFRSKALKLHTTRSWDFMGLALGGSGESTPMQLEYGDDVIVGLFDTGVWPESESFSHDTGTGPTPPCWRGKCIAGDQFDPATACNNKLIGARYYLKGYEHQFGPLDTTDDAEYRSPRDRLGHGSHTASTAVGSISEHVSYLGQFAGGTARGGAPRARLAVYKICWSNNLQGLCTEADILAAFNDALKDGVHIISASIGSALPLRQFFLSSMDIGSFHAVQLGVTVVLPAGNNGPESMTVENVTPWGVCVAAGTIDRSFPTKIVLGNNQLLTGEGFIGKKMRMRLVDGRGFFYDRSCYPDQWNGSEISQGTIILCFSSVAQVSSTDAAKSAIKLKASGLIFAEPSTKLTPQDDLLPTVHVDLNQGTQILYYIKSTNNPTVQISASRSTTGRLPAPSVTFFSSRGPSSAYPNILKPDIAAPGVNILAAWSPKSPPSQLPPLDTRSVNWNFQSGTSMACPHVSGIVALLKSAHPDWSPAAIKSALMTTAITVDTSTDIILAGGTLKPVDPFDIGAGHVNPLKAMDPGLVYDMGTQDYISFLCSIGYTRAQITKMVQPSPTIDTSCAGFHSDLDLNYPAIVISDLRDTLTVTRTVRNVGHGGALYFVSVVSPQGVHVHVSPPVLVFFQRGERISYEVTVTPWKWSRGRYDFGQIVWFDGYHRVRIPIAVSVNNAVGGDDASA